MKNILKQLSAFAFLIMFILNSSLIYSQSAMDEGGVTYLSKLT